MPVQAKHGQRLQRDVTPRPPGMCRPDEVTESMRARQWKEPERADTSGKKSKDDSDADETKASWLRRTLEEAGVNEPVIDKYLDKAEVYVADDLEVFEEADLKVGDNVNLLINKLQELGMKEAQFKKAQTYFGVREATPPAGGSSSGNPAAQAAPANGSAAPPASMSTPQVKREAGYSTNTALPPAVSGQLVPRAIEDARKWTHQGSVSSTLTSCSGSCKASSAFERSSAQRPACRTALGTANPKMHQAPAQECFTAVGKNGLVLKCADGNLQADREVVLTTVGKNGSPIWYADKNSSQKEWLRVYDDKKL